MLVVQPSECIMQYSHYSFLWSIILQLSRWGFQKRLVSPCPAEVESFHISIFEHESREHQLSHWPQQQEREIKADGLWKDFPKWLQPVCHNKTWTETERSLGHLFQQTQCTKTFHSPAENWVHRACERSVNAVSVFSLLAWDKRKGGGINFVSHDN